MATNVQTQRAQCRARLERLLLRNGWTHYDKLNLFGKDNLAITMDDDGIWFYDQNGREVVRKAGLAWDSMPAYIKDGTLEFPNGVSVQL